MYETIDFRLRDWIQLIAYWYCSILNPSLNQFLNISKKKLQLFIWIATFFYSVTFVSEQNQCHITHRIYKKKMIIDWLQLWYNSIINSLQCTLISMNWIWREEKRVVAKLKKKKKNRDKEETKTNRTLWIVCTLIKCILVAHHRRSTMIKSVNDFCQ